MIYNIILKDKYIYKKELKKKNLKPIVKNHHKILGISPGKSETRSCLIELSPGLYFFFTFYFLFIRTLFLTNPPKKIKNLSNKSTHKEITIQHQQNVNKVYRILNPNGDCL